MGASPRLDLFSGYCSRDICQPLEWAVAIEVMQAVEYPRGIASPSALTYETRIPHSMKALPPQ
ncbi:hypothetical protein QUB63_11725 [Microcoleus sp. ARI1-B5]|uniref:hypothetical protein n=1 Tax=unclassified Microcoleus TaxID=2642155 RepID=UPI002FD5299A